GLTAAPLAPPTCRGLSPDLNAFSFGYRDAVHLASVLYQKSFKSGATGLAVRSPDTLGELVLDQVLSHRPPVHSRDDFHADAWRDESLSRPLRAEARRNDR